MGSCFHDRRHRHRMRFSEETAWPTMIILIVSIIVAGNNNILASHVTNPHILPSIPSDPARLFPLVLKSERLRIPMHPDVSNKSRVRLETAPPLWEQRISRQYLGTGEADDFEQTCTHCDPLLREMTDGTDVFGLAHVHITKTGGTAVRACNHRAGGCHATVRQIRENLKHNGTYRTFAVIRHPLSRFVSAFYDKWQGGHVNNIYNRTQPEIDDMERCAHHLQSLFDDNVKQSCWWKPQVNWVLDDEYRLNVDYLLQFEHLLPDYATLQRISTLKHMPTKPVHSSHRLLKLNITYPNWCSFINTSISALVNKLYASDFTAFPEYYQRDVCV